MEPPITRIERDNAMQVRIRSSVQAVIAVVAARTSTPPTPKTVMVVRATANPAFSGMAMVKSPPNAAVQKDSPSFGRRNYLERVPTIMLSQLWIRKLRYSRLSPG